MTHIIRSCFLKLSVINNAVIDFGWLAQLVEHLVYTEVGDQAQTMNSSFHNNTNRPSQLMHDYKPGIE